MKVNCRALKISIWISSISIILSILFTYLNVKDANNAVVQFIKDTILGIFGSSVVAIFFHTSAYRVERKKVVKQYWNEVKDLLDKLSKIYYLYFGCDQEFIINYLREKNMVASFKEYYKINNNENLKKEIEQKIQKKLNYTKAVRERIENDNWEKLSKLSKKEREENIDKAVDAIITDKINRIIHIYNEYDKYNIVNLEFILEDMQFFTSDENYEKAYEMYQEINNILKKIQETSNFLKFHKVDEGNKDIILAKIFETQQYIFKVEEETINGRKLKLVYNEFNDMMQRKLEEFRTSVMYKTEPKYEERIPILIINKKFEEKIKYII